MLKNGIVFVQAFKLIYYENTKAMIDIGPIRVHFELY